MTHDDPALTAARNLTAALEGFNQRLDRAEMREKRLTHYLLALGIATALLALAFGITTAILGHHADVQQAANTRRDALFARLNCEAGNRYRAGIRAAFGDYSAIVAYKPGDAAKVPRVAAEVRAASAPRDCAALELQRTRTGP